MDLDENTKAFACDDITVREFCKRDITAVTNIWNQVVEEKNAFPQINTMNEDEAYEFFSSQTYTGVAEKNGRILGLYILHPNNIGRCGHLSNASYAVAADSRGMHVGELLVKDCLKTAKEKGYRILQFNAVVCSNAAAVKLYEKLGFVRLGTVPGGFLNGYGQYEDIILFYHTL